MADQPSTNTLDANKFYVAVRLIQLFQNGKKPVDLALNVMMETSSSSMKPPYFEGVEVPQLALSPQQQQQGHLGQSFPVQQQPQLMPQQQQPNQYPSPQIQPLVAASSPQRSPVPPISSSFSVGGIMPPLATTTATPTTTTILAIQDPYTMTPQELSRYDALFPMYATQDTADEKMYVHGATAVELFCKSGMDRESLKGIWTMVDDPIDNKLDSVEFAVAMHLIVCVTKKGLPTPLTLPGSLVNLVRYARSQQQQHTSAVGGGGGGSVMGVSGGSMTPQHTPPRVVGGGSGGGAGGGGIPTPDNLGGEQQPLQQPQMNGGMSLSSQLPQYQPQMQQQQQQPPLQQPQMMTHPQTQHGAQQQPWLAQPQTQQEQPAVGMQQQQGVPQMGSFGVQPTGVPQTSSFGGGGVRAAAVGKLSTNDAFDGLSNDPVADVDEYSTIGSEVGQDFTGGGEIAASQSVSTWETSLRPPLLPSLQQHQVQGQPGQTQFHQQQHHHDDQLPPRSLRGPPKSPRSSRITASSPVISSEDSTVELLSLREANQKLQAEVISLRAKAASVTDEEMQVQNEIKSVASEIGKLSLKLSTLKESVMEAKVKLGESVGVLKVQMGKKEYLEAQIAEAHTTHEAINSAALSVEEANELAMTMKARAVAAGAAYKDGEANTVPALLASQEAPAETTELFSWDAPSDISPGPSIQLGATSSSLTQEYPHQPAPVQFGFSNTPSEPVPGWEQPTLSMEENDNYHMYSNPKSYGNYGDDGMGALIGGGVASLDYMGAPMGGGITPMGQNVSENTVFTFHSDEMSAAIADNTKPHHPTNGTSPTESDLNLIKSKIVEAEYMFRDCTDLVRRLSSEVVKLEASVKDADADVFALEGKTKKTSTFGGKKKKVKAEHDKAVEWAQMERSKLEEAKKKLIIAEREAADAEREMENMRQKCEEIEMEAATNASYWSAQQEHDGSQQNLIGGYQQPQNQHTNSSAIGSKNYETSSDPYGMGFMGSAPSNNEDYDNPFAM